MEDNAVKKRNIALVLSFILIAALLCGCGAKSSSGRSEAYYDEPAYDYYVADSAPAQAAQTYAFFDGGYPAAEEAYEYYGDMEEPAAEAPVPNPNPPVDNQQNVTVNSAKLIYTADLEMETKSFDEAVSGLAKLTSNLGGYYESSSVSESGSTRRAYFTVRVPAEYYRAFLDSVAGELCHVLSQQEYTEDVSEYYYDTAGRLETQKTKLGRLQELLLQAEDMADIITIEDAISETEEMIDRLSGTLRRYDALVSYSTVNITLREVKVYEPEPDPTYGSRLGGAFVDGLKDFFSGIGDILVALAYCWLWLVVIAAIVVLILWLTRKRRAAAKAAREERKARKAVQKEALEANPPQYSAPAAPEEPEAPKDEE